MYGIECYVSKHAVFHGKIKESSKDFEVREIDLDGNIAGLTTNEKGKETKRGESDACRDIFKGLICPSGSHPHLYVQERELSHQQDDAISNEITVPVFVPVSPCTSLKRGENVQEAKQATVTGSKDQDRGMVAFEIDKNQPRELLQELLDASVLTELDKTKFVNDNQFSNDKLKNLEISLGIVSDKSIRTKMHQCLRYVYPYLKTVVSKTINGENEIKIMYDSSYSGFLSAGIAKDNIDDFFRFIHCQLILKDKSTFVLRVGENKEQRTLVHRLIKQHFGTFAESKTFVSDDAQRACEINIRFRNKRKIADTKFGDREAKSGTGGNSPGQVYRFILCERNIEISDAISKLSHSLKAKPSAFSFAGTKDKKAVTYQFVTTNEVPCEELSRFAKVSTGKDVEISGIEKVEDMLRLGDLSGNAFKITLRDFHSSSEEDVEELTNLIKTAISNVSLQGFVNYFGIQRFGFEENLTSSADVGLAMLKGDLMNAVDLILMPTGRDDVVDEAKQYYIETKDIVGAAKRMPVWKTREFCILKALKQHGYCEYGCCQAILSLPYNVRLMYVHSYCSLLWNKMATKRIKMFGLNLAQGDIILSNGNPEMPIELEEIDVTGRKFRVADVVLPLPGFRVSYPSNIANYYEEALRQDGLDRKDFKLKKLRLNVPGVYRKLISYPMDMKWRLHADEDNECKETIDYSTTNRDESGNTERCSQTLPQDEKSNRINVDLELQFSLVSSSYATICLREIMQN